MWLSWWNDMPSEHGRAANITPQAVRFKKLCRMSETLIYVDLHWRWCPWAILGEFYPKSMKIEIYIFRYKIAETCDGRSIFSDICVGDCFKTVPNVQNIDLCWFTLMTVPVGDIRGDITQKAWNIFSKRNGLNIW